MERLQSTRKAMCTSSLRWFLLCEGGLFLSLTLSVSLFLLSLSVFMVKLLLYLKDIRMRKGKKVRMKRRKLATDPEVAFFMMTERRKVNMMMEMP